MRKNNSRSLASDNVFADSVGGVDDVSLHRRGTFVRSGGTVLGALGLGAALMYFLDPARGRRRRSLARDKIVHVGKVAGDTLEKASRDIRNRARGTTASLRSRLRPDDTDDDVLVERVRAELGRVVAHPSAIHVDAVNGDVILSGDVLAEEVEELLSTVGRVRGVHNVDDQLDVHESAEGVSSLQGGVRRRGGPRFELRQENWTPAARVLTTAAGSGLMVYGMRRRDSIGTALGVAGLAMAARGSANMPLNRLVGVGGGRQGVNVQKTIHIDAPVEEVFSYLTDYQNWPRFMSHVKEVRDTGSRTQHWVVDGPAGTSVEWDAEITRFVDNELVSWKSVEGEPVRHAGTLRCTPSEGGGTRVDVRMSYNPPAGAAGHVVAMVFGRDPKKQMDDDLARLRTGMESGTSYRERRSANGVV